MVSMQSPPVRQIASYNSFLHSKNKSRIHPKYTVPIENQQFVMKKVALVYSGNLAQSAVLQSLFDTIDGRILAEVSLAQIARRICTTWEPQQLSPSRLLGFVKFIKFILTHTNIAGETLSLDSAIDICNYRDSAFPTVHAPLVLLLTLGYLERLSNRYGNTKGEPGCAQRLFLVAYTTAAKFLHANLVYSGQLSPLLQRSGSGASAFKIHPSQYSRPSSPSLSGSPPQSPTTMSASQNNPLIIMTASTNYLAQVLPNVTTRELYRMEIEFLSFLNYDISIYGVEEVEIWKDLYIVKQEEDSDIPIKREEEDVKIKLEHEDEGIDFYESEEGGNTVDAMANGNMLM